jgi:hypothetical protein
MTTHRVKDNGRKQQMEQHAGRTSARRGRIALVSLLACGAFLGIGASAAGAATPVIVNTGDVFDGHREWLESWAIGGENRENTETVRISMLVQHDIGRSVSQIRIDEDWDGSNEAATATAHNVTDQQPVVSGGYAYSRFTFTRQVQTSGVGFSCPVIGTRTRRTEKNLHVQVQLDNGDDTATSTSNLRLVDPDSNCLASQDYPVILDWSTSFTQHIEPGDSATFTFKGDDIDSPGSDDDEFGGVRWRLRNTLTGAVSGETTACAGNDNSFMSITPTFPDRGRWIVEGEMLNEGSGGNNCISANNDYWFALGAADVNSANPASLNLLRTPSNGRPATNGDVTITADLGNDPDNSDGGRSEMVEWDLDNNGSFETVTRGTYNNGVSPADPTQTIDTTGDAPGVYTVRARVTDNGAMGGADNIRRVSAIDTVTYTVNSLPVVNNQTITTDTNATNVPINLGATDANSDPLDYSITNATDHGTLSNSGTDDPTYTPTAGYAGTDAFTVQVDDGFGGIDTATVSINVRPNTTILTNPPNPSTSTSAGFTFSSNGSPVTFQCELNDGGFTACTSPRNLTGLSQGTNKFEVRAVATTGAVTDPSPAVYSWVIDSIPPETNLTDFPPALSNSTSAEFEFDSPDGTASFECRIDSPAGPWTTCTSPRNLTSLSQGPHTFEVRAKDPAGNVDATPATHTWNVDTIAPTTTLDTFPAANTNVTSAGFSFHADESAAFECELDGGGFSPCTSPQDYAGPLPDGPHVFKVRATDPTGNLGNTVTHNWNVDTVEPETTIDVAPDALTNQSSTQFEFSSNESPNVTFQCRIDSTLPAAWGACTSPKLYSLAHGSHTFEVRATDAAGNTDPSPDVHTWTIDLVNPNTAIDDDSAPGHEHPLHRTTSGDAQFDFISFDPTVTEFECQLDTGGFQDCSSPELHTGLPDGPHTFQVRAIDPAGNVDPTPATWIWEVYTGLPQTIIDTFPSNPDNDPNPSFTFHSSIPDSTFECTIDGEPVEPCTSPQAYTGLGNGPHTFTVVGTDEFGRIDPTPAEYTWTIDLDAPGTSITGNPPALSNSSDAQFQFESTEANSTFECRLDPTGPGGWTPCGEFQPEEYTGLTDGDHTFEVRAIDQAGNVDPDAATFTWTIDTQAPDTTISDQPADPSNINNPDFEFNSTEAGSTFECRRDSSSPADWEPCDTGHQYTDLTQGSHTFEVRATDPAGNTDQTPDTYTWFVDLTAPDTSITSGPDNPTNETLADFVFGGSDNHSDPGDLSFECRINSSDENDWDPCSSPEQYTGLTEGANKLEIRASDQAGNTDTSPAIHEWVIDLTAATATITDGPDDPTTSTSASVEFTSEPGATFECRLDSTDDNDWEDCVSPFTATVGEGPHVFEVRATDTAGNTGPVDMHSWLVDQTAPDTTITGQPGNPSNDTSPTFDFTGDDTPGSGVSSFECNLDSAGFEPCTSGDTYPSVTADGPHTFEVRAIDNTGNVDATPDSYNWVLDTGAPQTTITGNPFDPTNSTSATFDFTGDDGTGSGVASFECEIDGGGFVPCSTGQNYPGLTPNQEHTFKVRAIDNAGNVDPDPASYTWEIDTGEPDTEITTSPQDPSDTADPEFAFESTENGSSFECRLDPTGPGGWNPCNTPLDLTGLADGSHTFEVRATDPSGNTDSTPDTHTWVIDTTEPDTAITGNPPNPSNDTEPSFSFNGSDPGGSGVASFECDLDGAGFEPCTDPKDYTGITTEGSHTFQVRAIDEAGNTDSDPAAYTWTVDTTAPGVTIDSGPDDPTNLDSGSLAFTVTGSDVATTVCELDGVPETVNCPSGTVPFTGRPDGPHEFTVTSTDTSGNSNSDTWTWTIDTAEPETTIDATPTNPTTLTNVGFGFSSDQSPATFECQMDAGAYGPCTTPYSHGTLLRGPHTFSVRATDAAGNTDATPATHAFTVAEGAVLGGKPPEIKRRIRALNIPVAGSFQVATVTCRAGNCTIDQRSAVIKIAGKKYEGAISIELVAKTSVDHLAKGDVAQVVVHFSQNVKRALVANHVGQLVVKISASTDAGGAAAFKKIKLKAKWLKALFG